MSLDELVRKLLGDEHADVLRETLAWFVRELMEAEVAEQIGAGLNEKSAERVTHRNGYRERLWKTRVGEITLAIPRLRSGSYFPSFLEPRTRSEKALVAVIQEAYVNGVSTRKVERLVTQLGLAGMSRSAVSRLCAGLDEQVRLFRERPLEGAYPYLWLDARVEKVREPGGVRSKALVVAQGVHETGRREIIGIDVGEAETEAFWREFLRGLRARGLAGVHLCVSDAHEGLKGAIAKVLGCPWQRCTVHFLRDMLGHCSKDQQPLVSGAIRQIFAAESAAEARERLSVAVAALEGTTPKVARLLEAAEDDLLAFMSFPAEHWRKLRSTNPLERVNREIGRRSDVVGIYPNDAALIRLAGSLLIEQNDEWLVMRRYLSEESMQLVLARDADAESIVEVSALPAA
ncbi:MAG: Transposase, Mutator family [Actinobacteria bacterium ADurb.BinA094]|nr:MAG: Transposase, Mutator family [Actinobacteria bacterium ADurb.BinA094]